MRRGLFFVISLACAASFRATNTRAAVCPAPEGADAVATIDADTRLDYLTRAFDREVRVIDTWSWTWGAIYTAGTIAEGTALGFTTNHAGRVGLEVGTIATAFGALSLTLLPLKLTLPLRSASGAAKRSRENLDPCLALANLEQALVEIAKDQAFATGVVGHIGNVAANIAIVLILGLGYGQWVSAGLSGGIGLAVGEANAFTQPHHLADVIERYRSGHLGQASPTNPTLALTVVPVFSPEMSGVAVRARW
jgi:hypothetical protein